MNISGLGSRNGFVLLSRFTLPSMTPFLMLFKCADYSHTKVPIQPNCNHPSCASDSQSAITVICPHYVRSGFAGSQYISFWSKGGSRGFCGRWRGVGAGVDVGVGVAPWLALKWFPAYLRSPVPLKLPGFPRSPGPSNRPNRGFHPRFRINQGLPHPGQRAGCPPWRTVLPPTLRLPSALPFHWHLPERFAHWRSTPPYPPISTPGRDRPAPPPSRRCPVCPPVWWRCGCPWFRHPQGVR